MVKVNSKTPLKALAGGSAKVIKGAMANGLQSPAGSKREALVNAARQRSPKFDNAMDMAENTKALAQDIKDVRGPNAQRGSLTGDDTKDALLHKAANLDPRLKAALDVAERAKGVKDKDDVRNGKKDNLSSKKDDKFAAPKMSFGKMAAAGNATLAALKGLALGQAAASTAAFFQALMMFLLQSVKAVGAALVSAFSGIMTTITTAVTSALSVGAMVVLGPIAAVGAAVGIGVAAVMSNQNATETAQRDTMALCSPGDMNTVMDNVSLSAEAGEAARKENIQNAYSVLAAAGASPETVAGILGNWSHESGIDSTAVETIHDEPFIMGPKKKAAEAQDYIMSKYNPSYSARFPNILRAGIGLGQWTDTGDGSTRHSDLRNFGKATGLPWYSIDTQLAYMLSEDSGASKLHNIIKANENVETATQRFFNEWEGINDGSGGARQRAAQEIYVQLKSMKPNMEYGESILAKANVDKGVMNGLFGKMNTNLTPGCEGDKKAPNYAGGDIVEYARQYLGWFPYSLNYKSMANGSSADWYNPKETYVLECAGFVWLSLWATGHEVPDNFGWYTVMMSQDIKGENKWFTQITAEEVQPGDVFVINVGGAGGANGHTGIFTSEWKGPEETTIINQGGMTNPAGDVGEVDESTFKNANGWLLEEGEVVFGRPIKTADGKPLPMKF